MAPLNIDVSVQPLEAGRLVYLPMAPNTVGGTRRGRIFPFVDVTNQGSTPIRLLRIEVTYPGSSAAAPAPIVQNLDIPAGAQRRAQIGTPDGDLLVTLPAPPRIALALHFAGHASPARREFPLAAHESPVARGAYRFPAGPADLELGEYWCTNGCTHGVGDGSQSFAYDIGVWGVDHATGSYSNLHPRDHDTPPEDHGFQNAHHRIFGKQIRAMADGVVVGFLNDCPNNPVPLRPPADPSGWDALMEAQKLATWGPFAARRGGSGNHVYVQHGDEVMLYAHLQRGTIPDAVMNRRGQFVSTGAAVRAGDLLGLSGNSGNSSAPHLHIHAIEGTRPEQGTARPILFRDTWAIDNDMLLNTPRKAFWVPLRKAGIPEGDSITWWIRDSFLWPDAAPPEWPEVVKLSVPETEYQALFASMHARGFRPVWIDAVSIGVGAVPITMFNVIFRPATEVDFQPRHGLSGTEYDAEFATWVEQRAYRVAFVESYYSHHLDRVAYAVSFEKVDGPVQAAYHGKSRDFHQAAIGDLGGKGFSPVAISVVSAGGERRYTALYEQRAVGAAEARSTLTLDEFQAKVTANTGRLNLVYTNAYRHDGALNIVGIWHQQAPAARVAHHLDADEFREMTKTQRGSNRFTRGVTGYQRGSALNFLARFSR